MRTLLALLLAVIGAPTLSAAPANAEVSCVTMTGLSTRARMIVIVNGPIADASSTVSVYAIVPPECVAVLTKASPSTAMAYAKAAGGRAVTPDQEKEIAEAILRTRRWAFRDALPEILGTIRRVIGERSRGADKMIADYRALIAHR